MTTKHNMNQPMPIPNGEIHVWELVKKDIEERDMIGQSHYGTRLQPFNGRDFLIDAYQEALDLVVYLRGVLYERDGK